MKPFRMIQEESQSVEIGWDLDERSNMAEMINQSFS